MEFIIILICAVLLLALFLLLRYEKFSQREPEHGSLTEPLYNAVIRGLKEDIKSIKKMV